MADDTGAPHEIPFLEATDPPSIHGITSDMAEQVATRLGFVGSSIIATAETRTNASYGLLTTPDRVQNVVVPAAAQVLIGFSALWKAGGASEAPDAAIFIGANQLRSADPTNESWNPQVATLNPSAAGSVYYRPVSTFAGGLASPAGGSHSTDHVVMPTTGVALTNALTSGGFCVVEALAAGTYDFSVQWRNTTGGNAVTVKTRKLTVRVLPF